MAYIPTDDCDSASRLLHAASTGDRGLIERLLKMPAWPDCVDSESLTPLCIAVRAGHQAVVKLLCEATLSWCFLVLRRRFRHPLSCAERQLLVGARRGSTSIEPFLTFIFLPAPVPFAKAYCGRRSGVSKSTLRCRKKNATVTHTRGIRLFSVDRVTAASGLPVVARRGVNHSLKHKKTAGSGLKLSLISGSGILC